MSLEQALKENTEAVRELIAVMSAGAGNATTSGSTDDDADTGTKTTRTTRTRRSSTKDTETDTDTKASKYTAEDVKAAAVKVKDGHGTKVAKELIKKHGKADELAAIKPENYEAFIAACENLLNGADEEDEDEDDGL